MRFARFALMLVAAVVLSAATAEAKTFTLGTPPVVRVTLPDSWGPEETDYGVEANSPDGKIYMSFEIHALGRDGEAMAKAMQEAVEWAQERGARLNRFEDAREGKFNEWPAVRATATGRDRQGRPTSVEVIGVAINPATSLIVFGWYETGAEQQHARTLAGIIESVRPPGASRAR